MVKTEESLAGGQHARALERLEFVTDPEVERDLGGNRAAREAGFWPSYLFRCRFLGSWGLAGDFCRALAARKPPDVKFFGSSSLSNSFRDN